LLVHNKKLSHPRIVAIQRHHLKQHYHHCHRSMVNCPREKCSDDLKDWEEDSDSRTPAKNIYVDSQKYLCGPLTLWLARPKLQSPISRFSNTSLHQPKHQPKTWMKESASLNSSSESMTLWLACKFDEVQI
jgi:hypothetical protein